MAIFYPHRISCVCGSTFTAQLAESINVRRSPEARRQILRGEMMHRANCSACRQRFTVEKPFYYTDIDRNALFKVLPRGERHTWKQASRDLDAASDLIPQAVANSKDRTLRVVFGMDELREKLVAQDAELDDREVELLKVLLVYEHPVLLRRPRLRLTLQSVNSEDLEFVAAYEHHPAKFRLMMPRRIAAEFSGAPNRAKQWAQKGSGKSLYEVNDHWVNIWRWSPQPTALDRLRTFAKKAAAGEAIETESVAFRQMLTGMPRGSQLPNWAKRDLRTLFNFAKKNGQEKLEEQLFELRFDIELENDWATNKDPNDIDTLWTLLKELPDTNVEGNTRIHEIVLDEGKGGGFYSPTSHDIAIGSEALTKRERFQDIVRHEVGHAVHEKQASCVNEWLEERFGWRSFEPTDAGVDGWVELMGGWGGLHPTEQDDIRDALRKALGEPSSWSPGPTPVLPGDHPWYRADFGPRLAFESTGPSWFKNFKSWYRAGNDAFFLNYWYGKFVVVHTKTLDLVAEMPDAYASMSHFEFFAELYALHFDLDDPKRKAIPEDVAEWMNKHIGAPDSNAPKPAKPST
jgi:hypothetical protein